MAHKDLWVQLVASCEIQTLSLRELSKQFLTSEGSDYNPGNPTVLFVHPFGKEPFPNGSDQPHLKPPTTPRGQELHLSSMFLWKC